MTELESGKSVDGDGVVSAPVLMGRKNKSN